MKKTTVAKL